MVLDTTYIGTVTWMPWCWKSQGWTIR